MYWSELKNPKQNNCKTISQTGVSTPIVANNRICSPRISVFEISLYVIRVVAVVIRIRRAVGDRAVQGDGGAGWCVVEQIVIAVLGDLGARRIGGVGGVVPDIDDAAVEAQCS